MLSCMSACFESSPVTSIQVIPMKEEPLRTMRIFTWNGLNSHSNYYHAMTYYFLLTNQIKGHVFGLEGVGLGAQNVNNICPNV